MHIDGLATPNASARDQLGGLLARLLEKIPGAAGALLGSGDGLKLAWTEQPTDDADNLAAVVAGLYSLGRQQFKDSPGATRQIIVEHDGGVLFLMSAGQGFTDATAVSTVLAVVTTPDAKAGQVAYEMEVFIRGLEEHLVVQARPSVFTGSGL